MEEEAPAEPQPPAENNYRVKDDMVLAKTQLKLQEYRQRCLELEDRVMLVEAAFDQSQAELKQAREFVDRIVNQPQEAPDGQEAGDPTPSTRAKGGRRPH